MTEMTCNIIKACKGRIFENVEGELDRVKHYMAKECYCSLEAYTPFVMNEVMFRAMCDYIDTCDKPSEFLREMNHLLNKDKLSTAEKIAKAFDLVQIKEVINDDMYINADDEKEYKYINGFTKELWESELKI